MKDLVTIAFGAFLVENIILTRFLGICPFLGVSRKRSSAVGMGLAVVFVILVSSIVTWLLYTYVLEKFELVYLQTIVFILVIASFVQVVEMVIKKTSPTLYRSLGIYLPLITSNCAVLGTATLIVMEGYTSILSMIVFSLASGLGFFFVLYLFSSLREKLDKAPIKEAFKGVPIALLAAAGMAIIFARLGIIF